MRPGFSVGGVVIGQRVPADKLAVRDVIVFRRPDMPSEQIVHRIIKLTRGKLGQIQIRTQGDANPAPDPWTLTLRQPYAYRVQWSVPLVGYAAVAFQNHRSWLLIGAGIVALIIAVNELRTGSSQTANKG
jgi:signal peptidase I